MARKDANRGAKEAQATRRRLAMEYRKGGMPFRQIAEKLGVTHTQVIRDVQTVLRELNEATKADAEELVTMEEARLDVARQAIYPRVAKGELGAIDRWLAISESFRRLKGLDAPKKVAQTTADGEDLEEPFDLSQLTDEELDALEELNRKARNRKSKAN